MLKNVNNIIKLQDQDYYYCIKQKGSWINIFIFYNYDILSKYV